MPRVEPFRVSVPATSANLGPGFDAVGVALSLHLRALVRPAARFVLTFAQGPCAPSHDGFAEKIITAMRVIDAELAPVHVHVENEIPLGKGLGSSAAASILGLIVAARAHGRTLSRERLAELACALEGHPDNALPAIYGGSVIAASGNARDFLRVSPMRDVMPVVVVPEIDLATSEARALLPERYDRADAVFNAGRAALLGAALASGRSQALRAAMQDRLHQPYRAPRIPGLAAALALGGRDLLGIALSGAGPSVIAFVPRSSSAQRVGGRIERCFRDAGVRAQHHALPWAARGAVVSAA